MSKIVLSYRRADSAGITGRIWDHLCRIYGKNDVFMDVDSIPVGVNFREYFATVLQGAKVLVVIVGPRWTGPRRGTSSRLMDEHDEVRIEIELAMKLQIPVVPVLVEGAEMPRSEDLPPSLRDLLVRNAGIVDGGRDFPKHMDDLKAALDRFVKRAMPPFVPVTEPPPGGGIRPSVTAGVATAVMQPAPAAATANFEARQLLTPLQNAWVDGQLALQRKNTGVAVLLAFFLGEFGVHRFYLGQTNRGLTMLGVTGGIVVLSAMTLGILSFLFWGPWIWALVDCFSMQKEVERINAAVEAQLIAQAGGAVPVPVTV